jgi:hypothetical protein
MSTVRCFLITNCLDGFTLQFYLQYLIYMRITLYSFPYCKIRHSSKSLVFFYIFPAYINFNDFSILIADFKYSYTIWCCNIWVTYFVELLAHFQKKNCLLFEPYEAIILYAINNKNMRCFAFASRRVSFLCTIFSKLSINCDTFQTEDCLFFAHFKLTNRLLLLQP